MPESSRLLVLDTHIWIWWAEGISLDGATRAAIDEAAVHAAVRIPAISIWEVAMLASKQRLKLAAPIRQWCDRALALPGFSLARMSAAVAIEACELPGSFHSDPADRLIVATARELGATLVSRDEKILAYGAEGHVTVLPG